MGGGEVGGKEEQPFNCKARDYAGMLSCSDLNALNPPQSIQALGSSVRVGGE